MTHKIKLKDTDGVWQEVTSEDVTHPDDRCFRDAWRLNGAVIELHQPTMVSIIAENIANKRNEILHNGVKWKASPLDSFNTVKLTPNMSSFLYRTQEAIKHSSNPRPNIHGGVLFQDGSQFNINDAGIVELAVFAYSWGLKISQIANTKIGELSAMTSVHLEAYDCANIDWTVTWGPTDIANGWLDNTLTQTP